MAKGKLFHRNQVRKEESYARQIEWRKSNELALIVCEGRKTEPNYLHGLRSALGISNATINILDDGHGNDPVSVVNAAISEYEKDTSIYDRVYCIFDKDGHANYAQALQLVQNHALAKNKILFAANSVPCFEVWLLLHYSYTTQAYVKSGKKSPCDCLISDLKKKGQIPNYEKNHKGIYDLVGDRTDTAIRHAKMLSSHNTAVNTDNPSTKMHGLVTYLKSIAPK